MVTNYIQLEVAATVTTTEREILFRRWLEEYKGLVFRVVRAYAVDHHKQTELYQDILVQLWSSLPAFRGESKESTWIYRVALNTALVQQRIEKKRRRRYVPLVELDEHAEPVAAPDLPDNRELLERVYVKIRELPEADRSLVLLHLDGVSYREMAEIIGISESNVGVRLNRIRKRLAELLQGDANEPR